MIQTQFKLAIFWIAVMLLYLLGDVLRISSCDFIPGSPEGKKITHAMWFGISILMSLPIVMVVLSVSGPFAFVKWANVSVAAFFFLFNLLSMHTYPSLFDRYLFIMGLAFNVLTVYQAWRWLPQSSTG